MSLDVFLSFRICPKHPNTHHLSIWYPGYLIWQSNLATRSDGRSGEIDTILSGCSGELKLSS